jgi:hypothetical protein
MARFRRLSTVYPEAARGRGTPILIRSGLWFGVEEEKYSRVVRGGIEVSYSGGEITFIENLTQ